MALYKRGNTWWVRFTTPDGREVRRSARTERKRDAQEFHDRLKAETWRVKVLMEQTCKDLGEKGRDHEFGAGLIDAHAAVEVARAAR